MNCTATALAPNQGPCVLRIRMSPRKDSTDDDRKKEAVQKTHAGDAIYADALVEDAALHGFEPVVDMRNGALLDVVGGVF